jgi:hypothetical protein
MKFVVEPKENEQLELTVKLPKEPRSVIHGVVKDCDERPIKDAVVKLFEIVNPCDPCSLRPLTHAFTDECGQFIFGPLCPNKKYVIKVWHDHVKITPIIIKPDKCDEVCVENCKDDKIVNNFVDDEEN